MNALRQALVTCERQAAVRLLARPCVARCTASQLNQKRGIKSVDELTSRLFYVRDHSYDKISDPAKIRSQFQEWNFAAELYAFNKRLGEEVSFENLTICFTDPSYIQKQREKQAELGLVDAPITISDNTQFYNHGISVMSPHIKAYLRNQYPYVPEECVEALHNFLLSEEILADISKWLGCRDLVLSYDMQNPPQSALSKVPAAVVGAIDSEFGRKRALNFTQDFFLTYLYDKDPLEIWDIHDAEGALMRILENEGRPAPEPRIIRQSGINTIEALYIIGFYVDKELIGSSPGETIAIAKDMAAHDALRRMFRLTQSRKPLAYGEEAYNLDLNDFNSPNQSLIQWKSSGVRLPRQQIAA